MINLMNEGIPHTEISETFLQLMVNAMGLSYFKYGKIKDGFPDKVNALRTLRLKLKEYEITGNTEFLVDVANYAMIEYMHPSIEGACYKPNDSSKGRIWGSKIDPINRRNEE